MQKFLTNSKRHAKETLIYQDNFITIEKYKPSRDNSPLNATRKVFKIQITSKTKT